MEKKEFNYIIDKHIDLKKDDLLGTKSYADTLKKIIDGVDPPFTIGLFGGWGTGKSSIIKSIEDTYNNNKN